MKKKQIESFEAGYRRLESIVQALDSSQHPLEEMLALYEEGIRISQYCEAELDKAELKVTQLQVLPPDES
ncbi:MAG: exodeoxyribonuclease VII small subunit [Chloroflexi bacterium]|nr:exodeoxyribonuclease VII small subunit [Chloroflexota bacterium]